MNPVTDLVCSSLPVFQCSISHVQVFQCFPVFQCFSDLFQCSGVSVKVRNDLKGAEHQRVALQEPPRARRARLCCVQCREQSQLRMSHRMVGSNFDTMSANFSSVTVLQRSSVPSVPMFLQGCSSFQGSTMIQYQCSSLLQFNVPCSQGPFATSHSTVSEGNVCTTANLPNSHLNTTLMASSYLDNNPTQYWRSLRVIEAHAN